MAVYQTLRATNALTFEQPLPWTSLSLYDWLQTTVTGFNIAPCLTAGAATHRGGLP